MVFSRYIAVLRTAGKLLQPSVLENEVRSERTFAKTASIYRCCNAPETSRAPVNSTVEKSSEFSIIFKNNGNNNAEKSVLQYASKSATAFGSSAVEERSATETFGTKVFVSDDIGRMIEDYESEPAKGPLDTCDEDLSHITPNHMPSFNIAAYADKSPVIQELAKLGVELYKLDRDPKKMAFLLKQNFSDLKPYIRFLHDAGVPADGIGAFITKNPMIFAESMDDLHTRIRYLRAHQFSVDMIARIVTRNPFWLMFSTQRIDTRLGFFQEHFTLNGSNVRYLATKQPRLITYRHNHVKENTFAIREEMGFNKEETRSILLAQPKLFMRCKASSSLTADFLKTVFLLLR